MRLEKMRLSDGLLRRGMPALSDPTAHAILFVGPRIHFPSSSKVVGLHVLQKRNHMLFRFLDEFLGARIRFFLDESPV